MTDQQKETVNILLRGGGIAASASSGFRLRDAAGSPVAKISRKTFERLKYNIGVLRKTKAGLWVIDKRLVRQLHGRSYVKRQYKLFLKDPPTRLGID